MILYMEEYFEDEDMFEIDSYESELEEEDQGWSDEEAADKAPPWPGDTNPSHESESDVESEPPGYTSNTTHQSWYQEEEETYEERMDRKTPDCYRSCSNTLWCEEDSEEDSHEKYNPPKRAEKPISDGVVSYRVPAQPRPTSPRKQVNKRSGYMSNSLVFSGSSKNPEVYLRWESNMKQWLCANNIPKDKKLSYAVNALVGDAYAWWQKEDTHTFRPVFDWGDLKARMYREFVKKNQTRSHISLKPIQHMKPRIVMKAPRFHTAPPDQHNTQRCPQVATHTPSSTTNRELQEKPENYILEQEVIEFVRSSSLEKNHTETTSPLLVSDIYELNNYCKNIMLTRSLKYAVLTQYIPSIIHLSFAKRVESIAGAKEEPPDLGVQTQVRKRTKPVTPPPLGRAQDKGVEDERFKPSLMNQEKPQGVRCFKKIKDKPPDPTQLPCTVLPTEHKGDQTQVSNILIRFISNDPKSVIIDLLSLEKVDKNIGVSQNYFDQNSLFVTLVKPDDNSVLDQSCLPVLYDSISVITHLFLSKGVENMAGIKEEPPDVGVEAHTRKRAKQTAPAMLGCDQQHGISKSNQIKGEPPDAPFLQTTHRGKTLNFQGRMKANLLYLGADCTISRSKFCQGGRYDADIRTMPGLEVNHHGGIMRNQCSDPECRPEDEKRRGVRSNNQPTRPKELPLKNHSKITYVKKNDRARTQLDRSYLEIAHEHLTETVTKPRKLHHEEFTRSFHTSFDIHQQTTYSMKNDRVRNYFEGPDFNLVRKATPGAENRREACSTSSSTRAFRLGSSYHQKMPYLESYDRRKQSHDRAKSGVGTYDEAIKSSSIPDHVPGVKEAPKAYYKDGMKAMLSLGDATDSRNKKSSSSQFYKAAPKLLCLTLRTRRAQRFSLENHVWRPGAVSSPLPQAEDTQRRSKELYSFSLSRFYPIGFSGKGFNEATPLVRIPELATTPVHSYKPKNALASAALPAKSGPFGLSIFEHF